MSLGLKYGLFCGAALSVWVLIEFAFGFHTTSFEIGQYSGYFSILIPIVLIFTALRDQQDKADSPVSWRNGIDTGFRIAFTSALLFTFFMIMYRTYINPEWIELAFEWQRKKLILGGATDDEIGRFTDFNGTMNSLPLQILTGFIGSITVSTVITVIEIPIIRLFFRKKV